MKIGKLPNETLDRLIIEPIRSSNQKRKEVKKGPSVGEDCALLDFGEDYVLVSTDPITATQENMGRLLATVCTNDIAACGGTPVALLVTALIPPTAPEEQISGIMAELRAAAAEYQMDLIGGHTEITDAVNRIVLSGTILGKVSKQAYRETGAAAVGDKIVMTKFAALEGTAILATEHRMRLTEAFGAALVDRAIAYGEQLSVLEDARIAGGFQPSAMHDITEGGLLGAASEAAQAAGCGFSIDLRAVPLTEETKQICNFFGIDPFGLIGSGALLIMTNRAEELVDALTENQINAAIIGEAIDGESQCIHLDGTQSPLIAPAADAIYDVRPEQRVIFVCTGNTCRSPMAEGFAKQMAQAANKHQYRFESRGLYANEKGAVSQNSVNAMQARGVDITAHLPKSLTDAEIAAADYIFTMTRGHQKLICAEYADAQEKTFTLLEFANGGEGRMDILDPFGQNQQAYDECADEIEACVLKIIERLP